MLHRVGALAFGTLANIYTHKQERNSISEVQYLGEKVFHCIGLVGLSNHVTAIYIYTWSYQKNWSFIDLHTQFTCKLHAMKKQSFSSLLKILIYKY